MRAAVLTAAAGLALAACASGPSQPRRPAPPTMPAAARPLSTDLRQQAGPDLRFVRGKGSDPAAVTILTSSRNLRPGQQGAVLRVRGVGNLMGSCGRGTPGVKFRLTYRGAGPPSVTQVRQPLARPVGLHLLLPVLAARPGARQRQAAFQLLPDRRRRRVRRLLARRLGDAHGRDRRLRLRRERRAPRPRAGLPQAPRLTLQRIAARP